MSKEDAIRAKHEFEDRLREFLDMTSVMSDREIEIALARIADSLPQKSKKDSVQAIFKGKLLATYLSLRKSGEKKHRKYRRLFGPQWKTIPKWSGRERLAEYFINCAAESMVVPEGIIIDEQSGVSESEIVQTVKQLAP